MRVSDFSTLMNEVEKEFCLEKTTTATKGLQWHFIPAKATYSPEALLNVIYLLEGQTEVKKCVEEELLVGTKTAAEVLAEITSFAEGWLKANTVNYDKEQLVFLLKNSITIPEPELDWDEQHNVVLVLRGISVNHSRRSYFASAMKDKDRALQEDNIVVYDTRISLSLASVSIQLILNTGEKMGKERGECWRWWVEMQDDMIDAIKNTGESKNPEILPLIRSILKERDAVGENQYKTLAVPVRLSLREIIVNASAMWKLKEGDHRSSSDGGYGSIRIPEGARCGIQDFYTESNDNTYRTEFGIEMLRDVTFSLRQLFDIIPQNSIPRAEFEKADFSQKVKIKVPRQLREDVRVEEL